MNNINFNKCTGKDVRVIIMDSGIHNEMHCINYDGQILNKTSRGSSIKNRHVDSCLRSAQLSAPNAEFILINVGDEISGSITEQNVILGMKTAITIAPKVIIMSFSFENISDELKKLIREVTNSGIIICASVDPIIKNSFPQSMDEVISIDEYTGDFVTENIFICNDVFQISPSNYSSLEDKGSSIATAYFGGIIACLAEFSPMVTADSLKNYYINTQIKVKSRNETNSYYLIYGQHDVSMLKELITDNYLYCYDDNDKTFKAITDGSVVEDSKVNSVDVICADDYMIRKPDSIKDFKEKNIPFSCFDNFSADLSYLNNESLALKTISIPSICICSYGTNMDKFSIQLYLNKHFKNGGYSVGNISFNPIARLLGFSYVSFPFSITCPQYINYLNDCLYKESLEKEVIISSVAGSFDRFVNFEHRLGDVSNMFFLAHNPDIIILSISDYIEIAELKKAKHFIENSIGAKVIYYVSKHSKDDNYYGPSDYDLILNSEFTQNYSKQIAKSMKSKVFSQIDLNDSKLFEYILKIFE